jgi:hypothetical protein
MASRRVQGTFIIFVSHLKVRKYNELMRVYDNMALKELYRRQKKQKGGIERCT